MTAIAPVPVQFRRLRGVPLEYGTTFTTLADAQAFANGITAYVGEFITVTPAGDDPQTYQVQSDKSLKLFESGSGGGAVIDDSSTSASTTWSSTKINQTKTNKAVPSTANNVALLNSTGDLVDSGKPLPTVKTLTTNNLSLTSTASTDTLNLTAAQLASLSKADSALQAASIVNNLTTNTTGYVLDAVQGKALNDKIAALPAPQATDITSSNLTVGGSNYARTVDLSATQVANLAKGGTSLQSSNIVNNLTTTAAGNALDASQGKVLNDIITALPAPQPTDITSTNLAVGGSNYSRTVDLTSAQITSLGKADTALQAINVINNLITTTAGDVLDASQGKALNDKIDALVAPQPTAITSTNLDVGGSGYARTVDLTDDQVTSLGKADSALQAVTSTDLAVTTPSAGVRDIELTPAQRAAITTATTLSTTSVERVVSETVTPSVLTDITSDDPLTSVSRVAQMIADGTSAAVRFMGGVNIIGNKADISAVTGTSGTTAIAYDTQEFGTYTDVWTWTTKTLTPGDLYVFESELSAVGSVSGNVIYQPDNTFFILTGVLRDGDNVTIELNSAGKFQIKDKSVDAAQLKDVTQTSDTSTSTVTFGGSLTFNSESFDSVGRHTGTVQTTITLPSLGTSADTAAAGNDTRIIGAIQKAGDTMTGQLNTITPVDDTNAANKQYVDSSIASVVADSSGITAHNADITSHNIIQANLVNYSDAVVTTHNAAADAHNDIRSTIANNQVAVASAVSNHNSSSTAHSDIRTLVSTNETAIALINSTTLPIAITTHNTATDAHSDIRTSVSDLSTDVSTNTDAIALINSTTLPAAITTHNTDPDAHEDIRTDLAALDTTVNTLVDDYDEVVDQVVLKVNKAGDAMTGTLMLNGDPTVPLAAAPKQYVDAQVAEIESQALTFVGYISATEPIVDLREGNLWYTGTQTDAFPWQVKTYTSGAWSATTTAYTAVAMDLWSNLDEEQTPSGTSSGDLDLTTTFNPVQFVKQSDVVSFNPAFIKSNQAGQVKVRFTGLTSTGFVANTDSILSIRSAAGAVSPAPTTMWPQDAIATATNTYDTGFFLTGSDETGDRLRENNMPGQCHRWRVAGNYSGKDIGNQGRMRCFLTNPDTGFKVSAAIILPSGLTDDDFTFEFTSIADADSLAVGKGYSIGFTTTFDDATLTVTVNSVVRISEAIDWCK